MSMSGLGLNLEHPWKRCSLKKSQVCLKLAFPSQMVVAKFTLSLETLETIKTYQGKGRRTARYRKWPGKNWLVEATSTEVDAESAWHTSLHKGLPPEP